VLQFLQPFGEAVRLMINTLVRGLTTLAIDRPRTVIAAFTLVTVAFAASFASIEIDTDPENMLAADQPDRAFYREMRERFRIHDCITIAVFDQAGIFRPEALAAMQRVIERALRVPGLVPRDAASLTTSMNFINDPDGAMRVSAALEEVPQTKEALDALRKEILANSMLKGLILSHDTKATAIWLPIAERGQSSRIVRDLEAILRAELLPGQTHHIAGLAIAEERFGDEMFAQMTILAPAAFALILLLIYLFFRQRAFLLPLALDSTYSIVWAMGLMIALGNTVHIMSSMVPIFLMPIALLDDIHILSAFCDRYRTIRDKRRALLESMEPLYRPLLQTSLTSAVGFASLALTNIPPVRVFGAFVAFGIMVAWLCSMMLVPAMIILIDDSKLAALATRERSGALLDRILAPFAAVSFHRPRLVLLATLVIVGLSVAGIQRLVINDNPMKWFVAGHPIRVAERKITESFSGTHIAFMVGTTPHPDALEEPEYVGYFDRMEKHLRALPNVGKTISVADMVRMASLRFHRDEPEWDKIPETQAAVAQYLFAYEAGGDPQDINVVLDWERTSGLIAVFMKNGDNVSMQELEEHAAAFTRDNPPPRDMTLRWTGLPQVNRAWQSSMVSGMQQALLGSFLVVFMLMIVELRSLRLAVLSMIPLTVAIGVCYGVVGWSGKGYDMPIAICSTLALSQAIDFAIHYLARWRQLTERGLRPEEVHREVFGERARAILRNAIVIAVGFLPLAFSSLTPYITVSLFFAALMVLGALATFLVLPAALRVVIDRQSPVGIGVQTCSPVDTR
jgi:uncharacterized protein